MKNKLKSRINFFVLLLIAAVLLFFAFRGVDFAALVTGFKKANYFWVALSLLVGVLSHVIRALRWQLLLEPIGTKPSLTNTLGAIITGYMANLVFPRLGEVTRCGTLQKTDKIPFETLFGTVLIERAFDVIMMLILLVAVFFIRIDFFGKFLMESTVIPIKEKIVIIFTDKPIIILAGIIVFIGLILLIRKNVFGAKFNAKATNLYRGLKEGVKSVFTMKKRMAFLVYTLLLWFAYWLMTWMLVLATGPTSTLGPVDGFFLLVVGSFGMAAPVQGGFGAFHIMTATALGIYGISWEDGLVYAIISHESQTMLVLVLGVVFMAYFVFLLRRERTSNPSNEVEKG